MVDYFAFFQSFANFDTSKIVIQLVKELYTAKTTKVKDLVKVYTIYQRFFPNASSGSGDMQRNIRTFAIKRVA